MIDTGNRKAHCLQGQSADKCISWEGGNGLPDSREFFLCVVVQVGLLLRLHFDYLGKRVRDKIKFMR